MEKKNSRQSTHPRKSTEFLMLNNQLIAVLANDSSLANNCEYQRLAPSGDRSASQPKSCAWLAPRVSNEYYREALASSSLSTGHVLFFNS